MYYADQIGLEAVYEKLKWLEAQDDVALKPAQLIERLARDGGLFAELETA